MADIFEKAKKFASDRAKAKGNFVKDFFSLRSITKAHFFNVCNGGKNVKMNEKPGLVWSFSQVFCYFQFPISATNFHCGASLVHTTLTRDTDAF